MLNFFQICAIKICKLLNFGRKFSTMKPDQIKQWLKETGKDRAWLAEKCGVSKSTVDGWMAGRTIPKPAIVTISSLMFEETSLSPKFTLDQFSKIQQRAKAEGVSVEEWIAKVIVGALALIASCHLFRSPADWSAPALANTAKAGLAMVAGLF